MGERAKIMLNEYTAKALLKRDDLDLDKFYSTDIKMMVKVAQQELKKKDNIINELEKWIKENNLGEYRTENVVDTDELLDKLKALKKEDEETRLNNIINRIDNFADRAIEVIKQRL